MKWCLLWFSLIHQTTGNTSAQTSLVYWISVLQLTITFTMIKENTRALKPSALCCICPSHAARTAGVCCGTGELAVDPLDLVREPFVKWKFIYNAHLKTNLRRPKCNYSNKILSIIPNCIS